MYYLCLVKCVKNKHFVYMIIMALNDNSVKKTGQGFGLHVSVSGPSQGCP